MSEEVQTGEGTRTSEEVGIRALSAPDLDAAMALAADVPTAPHWPRSAYEAAIDPAGVPLRIALAAVLGGVLIGFAIASVIAPEAELETIVVDASHQRRKAGSALLGALLRELAERQVAEISLEVRESNAGAQGFYRARGFAEFARREGYYADSGEAAILMKGRITERPKIECSGASSG